MVYSFFVIVEGSDPKIYKIPRQRTARLISEFPDQKFQIYETLQDAKRAALTIVDRAPKKAKAGIVQLPGQPTTQNKDLGTTISELTEDRVDTYRM